MAGFEVTTEVNDDGSFKRKHERGRRSGGDGGLPSFFARGTLPELYLDWRNASALARSQGDPDTASIGECHRIVLFPGGLDRTSHVRDRHRIRPCPSFLAWCASVVKSSRIGVRRIRGLRHSACRDAG